MSDKDTGSANGSAQFTERELQMLGWAMQSLKTGPPEIDYEKLASFAGMSNRRSASNAWAKIKSKLTVSNPDGAVPATPKKTGGKKKAAATPAAGDDDDEAAATPKKTPRKRAAKKQDVDGEASPKKKGPGRGKKAAEDEEAVKADSDEPDDAPVKTEATEDNMEDEV